MTAPVSNGSGLLLSLELVAANQAGVKFNNIVTIFLLIFILKHDIIYL